MGVEFLPQALGLLSLGNLETPGLELPKPGLGLGLDRPRRVPGTGGEVAAGEAGLTRLGRAEPGAQSRAQGCLLGPWGGHQEHPEGRKIRGRTLTRADLSAQKLLGTFLPSKYLDSEMDGQVTARPGRPGCRIF